MVRHYIIILAVGTLASCGPLHDDIHYRLFGPDPDVPVYMKHPETGVTYVCPPFGLDPSRHPKMPDWKTSKLIADCVERKKRQGYVKVATP